MEGFLRSLIDTGQPLLDPGQARPEKWLAATIAAPPASLATALEDLHHEHLLTLPGKPLPFHPRAAIWGLTTLFVLASATVFRQIELRAIAKLIPLEMPDASDPAAHFSADLTLHYLADLRAIICRIADGDPLLGLLEKLALAAPLSSVGIPLNSLPDLSTITAHPGLAQLHAERVLEFQDRPRAEIPAVATTIHHLLGSHSTALAPGFASLIPPLPPLP